MFGSEASARTTDDSYFRQAAKLRWCLQHNIDDHAYADQGGRIVYLTDANVVRFFLDPERDRSHVAAFGPGSRDDYAAATALVTAEYLFSRALPGQHASPALIAPAHGDDIQDVIMGMQHSAAKLPVDPVDPAALAKLRKLVKDVRDNRFERPAAIAQLREMVPTIASHLLEGGGQAAHQLLRLYDSDLLRPLALHPAATRDILELGPPQQQRKRKWIERLHRENPGADLRLIERDAEVIVQTMMLDAAAAEEECGTRYVLLTADNVLMDAYTRWFWEEREQEDPGGRFLLRSPLQYAPILNVQDMPNGITRSDVIQRARDALDGLFINAPALRQGYPNKLAYYRLLARNRAAADAVKAFYGYNPMSFDASAIEGFRVARQIWRESFRNGVVLNAELMRRRLTEEFELLARLLREDTDFLTALHEDQRRIIERVFAAHASLTTRINVRYLTSDETGPANVQRAPLILRKGFAGILGSQALKDALNRLAQNDSTTILQVQDALSKAPVHEAYFFAACVAHRCAHWQAARLYARWAQTNLPLRPDTAEDQLELDYLQASATRYEFAAAQPVCNAFAQLEAMIGICRKTADQFGLIRAFAEATSLLLVALYRRRLIKDAVARDVVGVLAPHLPKLGTWLLEAWEALHDVDMLEPELRLHICANVISTEVYVRFMQRSPSVVEAPARSVLSEAIDHLAAILDTESRPLVLAVELAMARFGMGLLKLEEVDELLQGVRYPSSDASDILRKTLFRLDNYELDFFTDYLSRQKLRFRTMMAPSVR